MQKNSFTPPLSLAPAWQEILSIFPDLEALADHANLQIRHVKNISSQSGSRPEEDKLFSSISCTGTKQIIRVIEPDSLAYEVGEFINNTHAYAAILSKEPVRILTDEPEIAEKMITLANLNTEIVKKHWKNIAAQDLRYFEDKRDTFAMVFQVGLALRLHHNGKRGLLSCPNDFVSLKTGDEPERLIAVPFWAFITEWDQFEEWWFETLKKEIKSSLEKIIDAETAWNKYMLVLAQADALRQEG